MAYSSISHLGWLIVRSLEFKLMLVYFTFYVLLSRITVFNFFKLNLNFYGEGLSSPGLVFSLLSLTGLPPFGGFIPKLLVLFYVSEIFPLVCYILSSFSVIRVFFYIRSGLKGVLLLNKVRRFFYQILGHRAVSLMLFLTVALLV